MSMWRKVFRLEWRILRRDASVIMTLGLFTLLLVVAAVTGGRHAERIQSGLERSTQAETERLSTLSTRLTVLSQNKSPAESKDPRDPVYMGKKGAARVLVLPPAALAPVAVGQRDLQPQAVRVNTDVHLSAERETETALSGPTRLMTGAFDLAFLFVVLFPLVVIALSYELLSGERERGTLAMLLSQPVSQGALVMGKAAARAAALLGVTALFVLVGLLLAGVSMSDTSAWGAMAALLGVVMAWALFWFAAAVAVNALGLTSANNALVLVGVWLAIVVVVPGLVHVTADAAYPPPSGLDLLHEAREATQKAEGKLMDLTGTHEKKAKPKDFAARVAQVQEQLAERAVPVLEEAHAQMGKRQSLMASLRFLSPAMVTQAALEELAGSGVERHRRFDEQADAFHRVFRAHFLTMIKKAERLSPETLSATPSFRYVEEPASGVMGRVLVAMLVLLGLALSLVLLALPRFRRVGRLAA